MDNDDRTARNCREAYARHGVPWSPGRALERGAVPVAGVKNGGSTAVEQAHAVRWTREVVELCPDLEQVLLLGAGRPRRLGAGSVRGLNSPGGRERFGAAIAQIARSLTF